MQQDGISGAWQLQPSTFRQVPVGPRGTQSSCRWCRVTWYRAQLTGGVGSRGTQYNSQAVSGHVVHSPTPRWCRVTWYTVQLTCGVEPRGTRSNQRWHHVFSVIRTTQLRWINWKMWQNCTALALRDKVFSRLPNYKQTFMKNAALNPPLWFLVIPVKVQVSSDMICFWLGNRRVTLKRGMAQHRRSARALYSRGPGLKPRSVH